RDCREAPSNCMSTRQTANGRLSLIYLFGNSFLNIGEERRRLLGVIMSAYGPKRIFQLGCRMSAFGGKADMGAAGAAAQSASAKTSITVAAKMSNAMETNATIAETRPMTSQ